jgi:hypothetical protein
MQYRTKKTEHGQWTEWNDLPDTLIFSDVWVPTHFEFRAYSYSDEKPAFEFARRI